MTEYAKRQVYEAKCKKELFFQLAIPTMAVPVLPRL